MTLPNYAAEGRVREACAIAGVLPTAIEDYIAEFRAHVFDETDMAKHIETTRTTKPQRWTIAGTENDELFVSAFGPTPNISKQGEVVKLLGESRAAEVAAQFGTKLGTGKPGTVPGHIKTDSTNASNPFLKLRRSDGSVDPALAAKVARMTASLGTKKTEAIARAVGKTITGLPLRA
jgi:hypothetical protein